MPRPTYDPNEHAAGEWRRDQISDEEWRDYDWAKTESFEQGAPTYLRGAKRRPVIIEDES